MSGAFGVTPVLTITGTPPSSTQVTILSRGTGRALKAGDFAIVNDLGRTWRSATTFQDSFTSAVPPDMLPVASGQVTFTGLDKALLGVPIGSRVLVVIPPKEGFGEGSLSLPPGVTKTDTAVLVFDVLDGLAADAGPTGKTVSSGGGALPTVKSPSHAAPTVVIPRTTAPTKLSITTLVQGAGPAVAKGQEVIFQYVGYIWENGTEFDSSWQRGTPSTLEAGEGQTIPAWDNGLTGVKVGSRVLIIAPPASAYGSAGEPDADIAPTDTVVFVIDVLGAYPS